MNKTDLINLVAEKQGKTKKETAEYLDWFLEEIIASLNKVEDVKLSGFGNFLVKAVKARTAVNPMTKEPITVGACKKVAFHASEILKERLK